MKFLKSIRQHIPGFRRLSSNSMIIAATYYGAAILAMVKYWYWGLALLALPFLVFHLLELNRASARRISLAVSVTAGVLVLLGTACGLSPGGVSGDITETRSPATPTELSTTFATQEAEPSALATLLLAVAPSHTFASTEEAATTPGPTAAPSSEPGATLTPPVEPSGSTLPVKFAFVASKSGKVFHRPECSSAKRIKPENLTGFSTREEALAAGLQPCKICKP